MAAVDAAAGVVIHRLAAAGCHRTDVAADVHNAAAADVAKSWDAHWLQHNPG